MQSNEDRVDAILDKIEKSSTTQQLNDALAILTKLISKYFCPYSASFPIPLKISIGTSKQAITPSKIK